MRGVRSSWIVALVAALTAPNAFADDDTEDEPPPPVTDEWREPDVPLELHWHILALPERAVELAFTPLAIVVRNFERYRLDRRLRDLLRNDAGTIVLDPKVKLSFGDGLGVGGTLKFRNLTATEDKLNFSALTRINGDYELGMRRSQEYASLEGRELDLRLEYEVDRNLRWYAIGNDSSEADERVVRTNTITALMSLDLTALGHLDVRGLATLGYRHQTMLPGEDPTIPSVGEMGDTVEAPADFDKTVDLPELTVSLIYDSRDTEGRPRTGWLADARASAVTDVNSEELNAMTAGVEVFKFVPLLPRHRTLVLNAGMAFSAPLTTNGRVPLHALTTLGRETHLRGYGKSRFRDRYGWWASAEYQYPIYEFQETGITLSTTLFTDLGRVSGTFGDSFSGPVHYSYGVGLRGAHDSRRILAVSLGFSPEGVQASFSVGSGI